MIGIIIAILVVGFVLGLAIWAVNEAPFIPAEFKAFAKVLMIIVAILVILGYAWPFAGHLGAACL